MARKSKGSTSPYVFATRLPLPGQSADHELEQRERLVARFQPADAFEEMWIEDIAYCSVVIEYYRAVIAAFMMACVKRAHGRKVGADLPEYVRDEAPPMFDASVGRMLDYYVEHGFTAPSGMPYLGEPVFAALIGQMPRGEIDQLRQMQFMLHAELAERDRIINQLHRTRRQAMHDAIEFAELEGQAAADGTPALPTGQATALISDPEAAGRGEGEEGAPCEPVRMDDCPETSLAPAQDAAIVVGDESDAAPAGEPGLYNTQDAAASTPGESDEAV